MGHPEHSGNPDRAEGLAIGVLGVGRIGAMHAAHFALRADVGKVRLIGRRHPRLQQAADEVVAQAVETGTDASELAGRVRSKLEYRVLEDSGAAQVYEGLDGLVIATSTDSHAEVIKSVLPVGIPLLIEKPLAPTVDQQLELIALVEERGVPCMMGYHRRFDEGHRRLREKVRSGELGTVRSVTALSFDYLDAREEFIPTSGGLWRDLAVHDFNALAWILDEDIVSVQAHSAVLENPVYATHGDADTGLAVLRLASGVLVTLQCGRNIGAGQESRIEVHGTEASAAAGGAPYSASISLEPGAGATQPFFEDSMARFKQAYLNEAESFCQLVQGQLDTDSDPRSCLAALRVAEAAEESASTGHEIRILPI